MKIQKIEIFYFSRLVELSKELPLWLHVWPLIQIMWKTSKLLRSCLLKNMLEIHHQLTTILHTATNTRTYSFTHARTMSCCVGIDLIY